MGEDGEKRGRRSASAKRREHVNLKSFRARFSQKHDLRISGTSCISAQICPYYSDVLRDVTCLTCCMTSDDGGITRDVCDVCYMT